MDASETSPQMLVFLAGGGTLDKLDFLVISVMVSQFLSVPVVSTTTERVFCFAGLTPLRPVGISVC
jgi:hypothetical protein